MKGRATVNSKKLLCITTCLFLLVLGVAGILWAQSATYNRPDPLMDYVPQELGFYDTGYTNWDETGCRSCHGYSTADRHHGVPMSVNDHLCYPCHATCTEGAPDCENGITIHRNCMTSGCHSWNDVQFGNQKWHHNTDLTDPENCIVCHNPNLVDEITPFRDFLTYPPSGVTPTPFTCENCHWGQDIVAGTTPPNGNTPGHPSTYEHKDASGNDVGFFEYNKPILQNIDTHHMNFVGNVATQCYKCHSMDPDNPSWDPYNHELIRYCETCHSVWSIHKIRQHRSDTNGWAAIGFHAGGGGSVPLTWQKAGSLDYAPQANPGFTENEMCFACHTDNVPPDWLFTYVPAINAIGGISPAAGSCGVIGQLRGEFFGEEQFAGSEVQMKLKADPLAPWITVPIHSWTDNLIEFQIPCSTLAQGNYLVRVQNEGGNSNRVVFTLKDGGNWYDIIPARGPCSAVITLSGCCGFGNQRSEILPDQTYYGVHHVVDFVNSSGEFTAIRYVSWSDTQIQVKLYDWFQDGTDTCSIDPDTGQPRNERNFVRDIGDENADAGITCDNAAPAYDECAAEAVIPKCDSLALGTFDVYVKAIYFGDDDASGGLSCGDTIFNVETSDPVSFELTNDPYIMRLNPKQIMDVNGAPYPLLKIFGGNFGLTKEAGDSVRIGKKLAALSSTPGLGEEQTKVVLWSDTLIKVRAKQISDTLRSKTAWVWIEKGGLKSNAKPLSILSP
jgi:hypothetical protein